MLKPETDVLVSRLDRVLQDHVARGVVGASLAMIQPGRELLTLAAGRADRATGAPLTPDRLFRTASTRKTWTAVAVLALVREGRIDLDRTVEGWFPRLPRAGEIRIRHLLSHRSGLPEYEASMPRARPTTGRRRGSSNSRSRRQADAPGETFVYSNTGYVLAGEIVAAERGEPLVPLAQAGLRAGRHGRDLVRRGRWTFPRERLARVSLIAVGVVLAARDNAATASWSPASATLRSKAISPETSGRRPVWSAELKEVKVSGILYRGKTLEEIPEAEKSPISGGTSKMGNRLKNISANLADHLRLTGEERYGRSGQRFCRSRDGRRNEERWRIQSSIPT